MFGAADLDLLEGLLNQHLGSPFFVKDQTLRYVSANSAMARLCGLTAARELIGRRAGDFFGLDLVRHYESLDKGVLTSGRPLTNVLEPTVPRNGERVWLLFTRLPVRDFDGSVVGVAANARQLPAGDATEACYTRVKAATEHLRLHFDEQVSLRETARGIGTSINQLERDFQRVFGLTPSAFLDSVRIDIAKALLVGEAISVARVAQSCGYSDHSAFSRRFLKQIGVTPIEYRRGHRASVQQQRSLLSRCVT